MKLDRFINRPVLSTVISILIVILGILGLIADQWCGEHDVHDFYGN